MRYPGLLMAASLTVATTVMKNWEPFVSGPALAMLSVYGRSCFKEGWNSSSNSSFHIDSPPVPVPEGGRGGKKGRMERGRGGGGGGGEDGKEGGERGRHREGEKLNLEL